MKLEARHTKVIRQCNYDTYTAVSNIANTAQSLAIKELYAKNKIMVGHWSNDTVTIKLNKRISNYNKSVI